MEIKRQLDVLNQHLTKQPFMCVDDYSIADMAIWAWYGQLVQGYLYNAAEFLQAQDYTHVQRWADEIAKRPAVQRAINLMLLPIN